MTRICGLDEAGRGPLAGPVVAGCVILGDGFDAVGLDDSKKLSQKRREQLYERITSSALAWGIGWCSPQEIDDVNILRASLWAMKRAWEAMRERFPSARAELALVDGLHCPDLPIPCRAIVGGDASEACISAASILAKVFRDEKMLQLHREFPQYGFDKHKGYPTAAHRQALSVHGASPVHRVSFRWQNP